MASPRLSSCKNSVDLALSNGQQSDEAGHSDVAVLGRKLSCRFSRDPVRAKSASGS